jgi:hypothetical protein
MATTYTLIASVTVGSGGAASIEFTSIPSTYTDLVLKLSTRSSRNVFASSAVDLKFNSNGADYSTRILLKESGVVSSGNTSAQAQADVGYTSQDTDTANTFGSGEIYIPNYASSNFKSFSADLVQENNGATQYMSMVAGLWSNTSAITSVAFRIFSGSFNFKQHSTAYLYGISNA